MRLTERGGTPSAVGRGGEKRSGRCRRESSREGCGARQAAGHGGGGGGPSGCPQTPLTVVA